MNKEDQVNFLDFQPKLLKRVKKKVSMMKNLDH
jgi:hypothetical protein